MRRFGAAVACLTIVAGAGAVTPAGSPAERRLIRYEDLASIDLPLTPTVFDALTALDYLPDEKPYGLTLDLDRDGTPEILLSSPEYRLCGNAGCPYLLLDARLAHRIGDFFGTLVVETAPAGGWATIYAISRRDIEHTNLQLFGYAAGAYSPSEYRLLDSGGMAAWSAGLK